MSSSCRIAVAVSPRLFGDSLSRTLREQGTDVTAFPPDAPPAYDVTESNYDVALVSESLPRGVTANVVLRVPDEGHAPDGVLRVESEEHSVAVGDLASLLTVVHRFCGRLHA